MRSFIPYGKQWIDDADIAAVHEALTSDYLTQGPRIEAFEKSICDYTGAQYCVAVANGTAALHLAVLALDIPSGAHGITTANTFAASANCMAYAGMKPVLVDIEPDTYNISVELIKKHVTPDTKLIIPVDFAGQPADMEAIYQFAREKNIFVIEDAAHAIGSRYANGAAVGSCAYSDLTTFSFHPVKTITTGEGGAITTNNEKLYKRLLLLRSHGITKNQKDLSQYPGPWYYEMQALGYNYRLTDLQAALGVTQMKRINTFIKRRREIVDMYNQSFADTPYLTIPKERTGLVSAFHLYVLQIDFSAAGKTRAEVMTQLHELGIGTQVHYIPVYMQPYYKHSHYKPEDFPVTEAYYKNALSIPLYPKMSDDDVHYVVESITKVLSS